MKIIKGNKLINIGKVKRVNWFGKFSGLMFCRREKAEPLLFGFKKPTNMKIHSFFVFFDFIAVWLDSENHVLALKKVKPFKINVRIKKSYSKLIEIPINRKNSNLIKNLVEDRKI